MDSLMALSPVDGRYAKTTEPLRKHLSEFGLISNRAFVMIEYVLYLAERQSPNPPTEDEERAIHSIGCVLLKDALEIQAIERKGLCRHKATNHDVKACEAWLRDKFEGAGLARFVE